MTAGQRAVLAALTDQPLTIGALQFPTAENYATISGRLRRLEDRGLVRRTYPSGAQAIHWELTHAGRSALNLTG